MSELQIIVAIAMAALIVFAIVWSQVRRRRRKQQRFLNRLAGGTRFLTWDELHDHYKGLISFDLDGPFDPNRHGNLHRTLTHLENAAEEFLKDWYR